MVTKNKSESSKRNIALVNNNGKNRHFGNKNSKWNGGNRLKSNHPCPQCGCERICEKRNSFRICNQCYLKRGSSFDRKKWYKELRTRLKQFSYDYLGGECNTCGVDNIPLCCYHFHHRDPKDKKYNIGRLFTVGHEKNKEKIINELDKCTLLCANCHAIETWNDRTGYTY